MRVTADSGYVKTKRSRRYRPWAVFRTVVVVCVLGWVRARGAEGGAPDVNFRSLEVYEKREAFTDILRRLRQERDARDMEAHMFSELVGLFQGLGSLPDGDARLAQCIRLQKGIAELNEMLRVSHLRRLAVLDAVRELSSGPVVSPEAGKLLRETDREIRLMMEQQQTQARKLAMLRRRVTRAISTIPPMARFVNKAGMTMRLVRLGKGKRAVYISEKPVSAKLYRTFLASLPSPDALKEWERFGGRQAEGAPATGVTWGGARRFCQWLTRYERAPYALPVVADCEDGRKLIPGAKIATWLRDLWVPKSFVKRRDCKRFAVDFVGVWDPGGTLDDSVPLFGEVPFARYETLSFYVVTPVDTGIAKRRQRLKAVMP